MEFNTQDYLKKAILDSQERVRDFMNYADKTDDTELKNYFREYAETEGHHASQLSDYLKTKFS